MAHADPPLGRGSSNSHTEVPRRNSWNPPRRASSDASTRSSAAADRRTSTRSAHPSSSATPAPGPTCAELKAAIGSFLAPFPDLTADVRYLVQEDDLVSSWVSYTATHEADFAGVPASGRRVKFAEWDLFRVRDGKIVEITQYCDLFTIMSQIGALPTAAPA